MPTFFERRIRPSLLSFLFAFMICALLGPLSRPVKAQDPTPTPAPVQMSLSSPFAYQPKPLSISAKMGRWFPVGVTLSNTGDPVEGEVRMRLDSSDEYRANDFYTNVSLPTNSRKIIWLYGRMERVNVMSCSITFSGRGFKSLSQKVAINEPDAEQRLVVTIADNNDGILDTLKSLRGQALFRSGKIPSFNPNLQPVRAVQISREQVPDRWIGLDAADLVVLGDFPHIALTPNQIDALRGYTYSGGTLLAMGGSNASRYASSPIKDLWPVNPTSSVSANAGEVTNLVNRYMPNAKNGGDRLGGAPVVVTRGALKSDSILKDGTAQSPLFSLRDSGAGRCLFLAYDAAQPPFVAWSGQGNLWRDIFLNTSKIRGIDSITSDFLFDASTGIQANTTQYYGDGNVPETPTARLVDALSKVPQLRMPPVSDIAWFLALYVFFLVPLNYAVLRFFDRRELAWISIPVIVLAFTAISYTRAVQIRGTAILSRQVDIVQGTIGQGEARTDSLLWLYTPRRNRYTLTSAGKNAIISDYVDRHGIEQGELTIQQPSDGSSFQVEDIQLVNDYRAFTAQSVTNIGKGVTLSGRSIRNNSDFDLEGAVWVQDRTVWNLDTIKKSSSATLNGQGQRLSGADLSGAILRVSRLEKVFDTSTVSSGIPAQALGVALGSDFGKLSSGATLIAWTKTPIAPIAVDGSNGRNLTLIIIKANKLTPQLALREAVVSRAAFEPFNGTTGGQGGGFAFYDCVLPSGGAKASFQLSARGVDATRTKDVPFEYWNAPQGRWQKLDGKLKHDNSPAGGWNFTAPISVSWARQPDSLLRVRVKLANGNVQVSSLVVS